ncbi:hypothetical protein [Aquimarina sp. 2304DJ70-9]|uniref:hypothetical protein n=1 Tax=Aquimarina penaris TaxID=3231044 RepID=UPI00346215CF
MKNSSRKIRFILPLFFLIHYFSFSQNAQTITGELQGKWLMCKNDPVLEHCITCPNSQRCDYQIQIKGEEYILHKENKKVDDGKFEIEHNHDQIYTAFFYSSLSDEIFEVLDVNTILLYRNPNGEFFFYMKHKEHGQRQCSLKRITQNKKTTSSSN